MNPFKIKLKLNWAGKLKIYPSGYKKVHQANGIK